jgi:F-type H+-transporting ATPase subunit b
MKKLLALPMMLAAGPALAAGDTFVSLKNTDFVVLIAFLVFLGVLVYFKVPGMIGKMLDDRAGTIRSELDEARALHDEARELLASYERKQREVQAQADRIVATAKDEAAKAAVTAKEDIRTSVDRRMAAATEQIESARAAAVKDVRDRAVTVAISAAREVIAKELSATQANKLIDDAIGVVTEKLH